MRRIIVLLTVAAAMVATVVLTASGAVAQGPHPLEDFCESVDGDLSVGEGEIPNCTYTATIAVVEAQHGFTRTTSQVYNITITQLLSEGPPGTPGGEPIVSCQSPGGRDVPLDNPNCTPAS